MIDDTERQLEIAEQGCRDVLDFAVQASRLSVEGWNSSPDQRQAVVAGLVEIATDGGYKPSDRIAAAKAMVSVGNLQNSAISNLLLHTERQLRIAIEDLRESRSANAPRGLC